MSEATTTNSFRQRLARHHYDGTALPQVTAMAFGDGGHNPDGTPKAPNAAQTALGHTVLQKNLSSVVQEDVYSMTGTGLVAEAELVGTHISEAGLLDASGNLLGFRNFAPKIKEADEEYEIKIKLKF
ncbi:MAG: phage tail protein [Opitutae bacterium]